MIFTRLEKKAYLVEKLKVRASCNSLQWERTKKHFDVLKPRIVYKIEIWGCTRFKDHHPLFQYILPIKTRTVFFLQNAKIFLTIGKYSSNSREIMSGERQKNCYWWLCFCALVLLLARELLTSEEGA